MIDLLRIRAELIALAWPSVAYCSAHGLDWTAIEAHAGGVYLAPIAADREWFDPDPAGVMAAFCEVRGADAVEVVDMVAWSLDEPARWWTAVRASVVLGEATAVNPATGFGGAPLRLFRTPLAWLKAGCDGVVILERSLRGGRWLLNVDHADVTAEDEAHAAELVAMRDAAARHPRILVPARAA